MAAAAAANAKLYSNENLLLFLCCTQKKMRGKKSANDYTNTNLDTKPSGKNEMNFIRRVMMPKMFECMFAICSAFISFLFNSFRFVSVISSFEQHLKTHTKKKLRATNCLLWPEFYAMQKVIK